MASARELAWEARWERKGSAWISYRRLPRLKGTNINCVPLGFSRRRKRLV